MFTATGDFSGIFRGLAIGAAILAIGSLLATAVRVCAFISFFMIHDDPLELIRI
jgi:hypothetical protein